MHDVDDGIVGCVLSKVLYSLISDKIVTLNFINSRIKSFPYSILRRVIIKPLFLVQGNKFKIKQSAVEMLCLVKYLGLMIGEVIPDKNKHWKLYKYLRGLVSFTSSPGLRSTDREEIKKNFEKLNHLYYMTYGELIPKMHFLTHYDSVSRLNELVMHNSTDIFERMNRKMKEMVQLHCLV